MISQTSRCAPFPSWFRRSGYEEQYEQQNAGLLRSALLKRFESSAYAFSAL
ncbi:hypothetical protein [Rhizohabitans arisaemae]|uniref:hypothetical protein n=1 Tax=Rhizohabitans arisaemae TaxID=2720610 RepID=UPI0024B18E35|nr:hypothetical protein [Rhizohabitans arisaemae]